MESCYAWIPTISGNVFLENEKTLKKKAKELSSQIKNQEEEYEYEINFIDLKCQKGNHIWKLELKLEGEERKKFNITCEINKQGLCEISSKEKTSFGILSSAYRYVRDIYHQHIHHSEDQRLLLVTAENKEEAIDKILNEYQRKIIYYRHLLDLRGMGR